MYKCCWHWKEQCLLTNSARYNKTRIITYSKLVNTPLLQSRQNQWHKRCWHETNQYLIGKQDRKQITRTMTCWKSGTNVLGLRKKPNTNGICPVDVEQIIIWLANNTVNKITEIMNCSKSTAYTSGLCKQNNTDDICWWQ